MQGTGARYSTLTKSKLQFIQLVRVHRLMTPVPGETFSEKVGRFFKGRDVSSGIEDLVFVTREL